MNACLTIWSWKKDSKCMWLELLVKVQTIPLSYRPGMIMMLMFMILFSKAWFNHKGYKLITFWGVSFVSRIRRCYYQFGSKLEYYGCFSLVCDCLDVTVILILILSVNWNYMKLLYEDTCSWVIRIKWELNGRQYRNIHSFSIILIWWQT